MTKKCKEARQEVLKLCENYLETDTREAYGKYVQAVIDFKARFHKDFDPHNLKDDYIDDYEAVKVYQKYYNKELYQEYNDKRRGNKKN